MSWGVGGWLLNNFLRRVGTERTNELMARVASEIRTTFASHYTQTLSLRGALDPANVRNYERKATGEKYLVLQQADDG